jgi:hypothetical protein
MGVLRVIAALLARLITAGSTLLSVTVARTVGGTLRTRSTLQCSTKAFGTESCLVVVIATAVALAVVIVSGTLACVNTWTRRASGTILVLVLLLITFAAFSRFAGLVLLSFGSL